MFVEFSDPETIDLINTVHVNDLVNRKQPTGLQIEHRRDRPIVWVRATTHVVVEVESHRHNLGGRHRDLVLDVVAAVVERRGELGDVFDPAVVEPEHETRQCIIRRGCTWLIRREDRPHERGGDIRLLGDYALFNRRQPADRRCQVTVVNDHIERGVGVSFCVERDRHLVQPVGWQHHVCKPRKHLAGHQRCHRNCCCCRPTGVCQCQSLALCRVKGERALVFPLVHNDHRRACSGQELQFAVGAVGVERDPRLGRCGICLSEPVLTKDQGVPSNLAWTTRTQRGRERPYVRHTVFDASVEDATICPIAKQHRAGSLDFAIDQAKGPHTVEVAGATAVPRGRNDGFVGTVVVQVAKVHIGDAEPVVANVANLAVLERAVGDCRHRRLQIETGVVAELVHEVDIANRRICLVVFRCRLLSVTPHGNSGHHRILHRADINSGVNVLCRDVVGGSGSSCRLDRRPSHIWRFDRYIVATSNQQSSDA